MTDSRFLAVLGGLIGPAVMIWCGAHVIIDGRVVVSASRPLIFFGLTAKLAAMAWFGLAAAAHGCFFVRRFASVCWLGEWISVSGVVVALACFTAACVRVALWNS